MIEIDERMSLQVLQDGAIWDSDGDWTFPIAQQLYAQMLELDEYCGGD